MIDVPCSPLSLLDYMRTGELPKKEKLRYAEAAIDQMIFFRDRICGLFEHRLYLGVCDAWIAGWHTSKSVDLPVYCIKKPNITMVARDNFHGWNVRVSLDSVINLPRWLVRTDLTYFFAEGMEQYKHGPYGEAARDFCFCADDRFHLWAIMLHIHHELAIQC